MYLAMHTWYTLCDTHVYLGSFQKNYYISEITLSGISSKPSMQNDMTQQKR